MFVLRAGCLAALSLGLITQAMAGPLGIDFNTLKLGEQVLNYYDGGFGSLAAGRDQSSELRLRQILS